MSSPWRRALLVARVAAVARLALVAPPALVTGLAGCATILDVRDVGIGDTAIFNDPNEAPNAARPEVDPDRATIQRHLVDLIRDTPAGETIRISTSLFASNDYQDALILAHSRGVHVQVLVDASLTMDVAPTTFHALADELGRDSSQSSFAVLCPSGRGCLGGTSNQARFLLFSATRGRDKVIVQTSANLIDHPDAGNTGQTSWNNAVTLVDEPALYDAYLARFEAMRAADPDAPGARPSSIQGRHARVAFYPDPSADATSETQNPILAVLARIDCSGANTTGGSGPDHATSIDIAMFELSDPSVAARLHQLDDAGCVVHVVHTNDGTTDDKADAALAPCDAHDGVTLDTIHYRVGPDDADTSASEAIGFIASKYLLIDGFYDGLPDQRRVLTGSYDFSLSALHSRDGVLLELQDHAALANDFESNFKTIADHTACRIQAGTCPADNRACQ